MAYFISVFIVVFISGEGTSGCSLANLDVPVVPFCENHQRSGRMIVTASDSVPEYKTVDCLCDVKVAGTHRLIATYESPGYLNCGIELQIGNKLYSCADSKIHIDVEEEFEMVYRKTTTRENPNMCITLQSEPESSSITIYCKKNEERPITLMPTTQGKTPTLMSSPRSNTSKRTHNTIKPLSSTTVFPSLVSNDTLSLSSAASSPKQTSSKATVALTPLSSGSATSVSSSTTVHNTPGTSDITNTIPDNSTAFIVNITKQNTSTLTSGTTDMTTPARTFTSENHITSGNYSYTSTFFETSPNRSNTSVTPFVKVTIKLSSDDLSSATKVPAITMHEVDNATVANSRQSKEDRPWEKVVIICSVTGCLLLLIIAVTLSILIYRNRTTRTKGTFDTANHQSYINAFDQEDSPGKNDEMSVNTLISNDHINEPSNRLISFPRRLEHNTSSANNHSGEFSVTKGVAVHPSRDGVAEGQASTTRRYLNASGMDMYYDRTPSAFTFDKGSQEPWTLYDHVGNNETACGSVRQARQHQQETKSLAEGQGYSEIYAIVRKPGDIHLQKKQAKLVSFKGNEEENEDDTVKPKGILKYKKTDMYPRNDSKVRENKENHIFTYGKIA